MTLPRYKSCSSTVFKWKTTQMPIFQHGSHLWPQTWLVEDIPRAHVLSVSYSVGQRHSSGEILDMYNIGENLLSDLLQDDAIWSGVGQVPVVLVGHSIGGLVIKELCCRVNNRFHNSQGSERAKLEKFLKNIRGIFYYATPHQGSGVAKMLGKKFISRPLLTYFEKLNKNTARLNSEFEAMCKVNYKDWLFAGLGEALPTNLGLFRKCIIVPEASARVGDFNLVEEADHFSVCRPRSREARSFTNLRDFVSEIAKASDAERSSQQTPCLVANPQEA